jgi:hypothetical protein
VRLYSRTGNDLTYRFPLIVEALVGLRSRSVLLTPGARRARRRGSLKRRIVILNRLSLR